MNLISETTQIRVSSTLDKSTGKKYLIDRNPETCWSSTQGTPQHVQLNFETPVIATGVSLTFQGGFVGIRCALYSRARSNLNGTDTKIPPLGSEEWSLLSRFFPEDVNRKQSFPISPKDTEDAPPTGYDQLKLVFEQSSDFFGRIVVYDLAIEGSIS